MPHIPHAKEYAAIITNNNLSLIYIKQSIQKCLTMKEWIE